MTGLSFRLYSVVCVVAAVGLLLGCPAARQQVSTSVRSPEVTADGVFFRLVEPDASTVHLIGTFNSWRRSESFSMTKNWHGAWEILIRLGPGTYEYVFLIDGAKRVWDDNNPDRVVDRRDKYHSVLTVRR